MKTAILILALLIAIPASAKPFYKQRKFWVGVGVIGAAVALDAQSSCRAFSHDAYETYPLLYGTRSCATVSGAAVGMFGLYTAMDAFQWHVTQHNRSKAVRFIGETWVPAAALAVHLPYAIHNYDLDLRRPAPIPPPCEKREHDRE